MRCGGHGRWVCAGWRYAIGLWLLLAGCTVIAGEALRIVYPARESATDQRTRYPVRVLALALQHSAVAFDLQASPAAMPQARSLRALQHGAIDVAWSVATQERRQQLLSVPIPIDRGRIGWRVLLVRRQSPSRSVRCPDPALKASFAGRM